MPKYAIAFKSNNQGFLHKMVEMDSADAALRFFFNQYISEEYTKDDEGFNYFTEDFLDPDSPMGNILNIE